MARLNFPNPNTTQTYTEAGITWTWNATLGVWSSEAGEIPGGGDVSVDVGDTRPSLPSEGDLWFCTSEVAEGGGRLYVYYEDGDTNQWVDVSLPGGGGDGTNFGQEDADALYLSKKVDDTAAGSITFKERSTHEQGLFLGTEDQSALEAVSNVFRFYTGDVPGGGWESLRIARNHDSSKAISVRNESPKDGSTKSYYGGISARVGIEGITATGGNSNSNNIPCGYTSALYFDADSSCTTYAHYNVGANRNDSGDGTGKAPNALHGYTCAAAAFGMNDGTTNTAFDSTTISGFYTNLNTDTAGASKVYAINSTGSAESYFEGVVTVNNRVDGSRFASRLEQTAAASSVFGFAARNVLNVSGTTNDTNLTPCGFKSGLTNHTSNLGHCSHFKAEAFTNEDGGTLQIQKCFDVASSLYNKATTTYGFFSGLGSNSSNTWNLYCTGNAKSYHRGDFRISDTGATHDDQAGSIQLLNTGWIDVRRTGTNSARSGIRIIRTNTGSTSTYKVLEFENHDATAKGFIRIDGSNVRSIDARMGATGVAMADGAADIVKLLQPKVITQGGETFNGFLPADLAGTFAAAVDGTAGATVAIGTYTNPEGEVETDVEEPEAIPYGATWQPTGTRDLMQGVCREELIPLLTKALQETIAKNEQLEARLAAIEANELVDDATDNALLTLVANLASRVTALEGA